jgi:hypothetical protein
MGSIKGLPVSKLYNQHDRASLLVQKVFLILFSKELIFSKEARTDHHD